MSESHNVNHIRRAALDQVDKTEKYLKYTIVAAFIYESALLITFLELMDLDNRTHVLLLFATFLIYGTLAIGIIALGIYVKNWGQRILKAIEILDDEK